MSDAVRPTSLDPEIARRLKRDDAGLFPAVAQQHDTGEVLMVGWMDDEALHRTLTTGRCTYWSRSRQEYWVKGDTSGHQQWIKSVALDCDGDTVLVQVDQAPLIICHAATYSFNGAAIRNNPQAQDWIVAQTPMGRLAEPHDIGGDAVLAHMPAEQGLALEPEALVQPPDRLVADQHLAPELVQAEVAENVLDDGTRTLAPKDSLELIFTPAPKCALWPRIESPM